MSKEVKHIPGVRLDEVATEAELKPLVEYFEVLEAARIKSTIERSRRIGKPVLMEKVEDADNES